MRARGGAVQAAAPGPYNERRGAAHADDSAVDPAKQALHDHLHVCAGGALGEQCRMRRGQ